MNMSLIVISYLHPSNRAGENASLQTSVPKSNKDNVGVKCRHWQQHRMEQRQVSEASVAAALYAAFKAGDAVLGVLGVLGGCGESTGL